jgi:hypothetical protein
MPRAYLLYGLLVLAWFGYAQYHGWSLGGSQGGSGSRSGSGGWHWSWGGSSDGGGYWGGGGFHK